MAQAVDAAPISIHIAKDGHRPSVRLGGRANRSNISRVVDVLESLAAEDRTCVSLDMQDLESIDNAAVELLASSIEKFKSHRRRLHLQGASDSVRDLLDRFQLTDLFCSHSGGLHPCSPEGCCHAHKAWEMDVFSFPSQLANTREARERIDRVAEAVGFSRGSRGDIALAVGEAITNAVKYGCGDDEDACFTVSCIATEERFCVSISDSGPGFCLDSIPTFEEALFMEHGRGVHCMRSVMDEVRFDFQSGTTVRMVKLGH